MHIIILAILSGIFYHLGGCGDDGAKMYPWLPRFLWGKINGKIRDWGCSIVSLAAVPVIYPLQWSVNLLWIFPASFLLSWGALSKYWKKGADMKAIHWFAHGTGIGLALIPFIWAGVPWWWIVARSIFLGATMSFVSEHSDDVRIEESGRGTLIIITMLLPGSPSSGASLAGHS